MPSSSSSPTAARRIRRRGREMASRDAAESPRSAPRRPRTAAAPKDGGAAGLLSPRFRSAVELAGWDKESVFAALVVEDTPVRESRRKRRSSTSARGGGSTGSNTRKRRSRRQTTVVIPPVTLVLDDDDKPDNAESAGDMLTDEQNELIESAAEMLYGLIHVRYILTSKGLAAMLDKYKSYDFGRCPRVYCSAQPCLPVGLSDVPRSSTVKIYCPRCEDIYHPRSKYQDNIDGTYFGTTFPHLFLMTYPHLKPQKPSQQYVPRVFGFKIHKP